MLAAAFVCGEARAGAWPTPKGETLTILKYERSVADEAFDFDGDRFDRPERIDETVSLYLEYGLTRRTTLQAKIVRTRGEDQGETYQGRGPVELGVRYALFRGERSAVSLYMGAVMAGEGRNAGYADPGAGGTSTETRLLAGRSFEVADRPVFVEAQVARLDRSGLPGETRLDLTLGAEPTNDWLLLLQTYSGWAESGAEWTKLEASAVRRFGPWRAQAGWRMAIAGKSGPVEVGPVLALWRLF